MTVVQPHPEGMARARAFVASRVKAALTAQDGEQLEQMRDVYGPYDPSLTAMVDDLLAP